MMTYKGLVGAAALDAKAGIIYGEVINAHDLITFHAALLRDLEPAFCSAVDNYLAFFDEHGEPRPEPLCQQHARPISLGETLAFALGNFDVTTGVTDMADGIPLNPFLDSDSALDTLNQVGQVVEFLADAIPAMAHGGVIDGDHAHGIAWILNGVADALNFEAARGRS